MAQDENTKSAEHSGNPSSRSPSGELGPDAVMEWNRKEGDMAHCDCGALRRANRPLCQSCVTLRDQFAMAALTGLLANTFIASHLANIGGTADSSAIMFTYRTYALADAMMEARKPKGDQK